MAQVPGDGVGPVVESFAGQIVAQANDQIDGGLGQPGRAGVRPTRAWLERGRTFEAITLDQARNPPLGNPLLLSHLRLATTLDNDSSDNQTGFRHPPNIGSSTYSDVLRHAIPMS